MFILTFYKFLDQIKSSSILLLNRKSSSPSEVKLRFAFESPLFMSAPAATDKGNTRYDEKRMMRMNLQHNNKTFKRAEMC